MQNGPRRARSTENDVVKELDDKLDGTDKTFRGSMGWNRVETSGSGNPGLSRRVFGSSSITIICEIHFIYNYTFFFVRTHPPEADDHSGLARAAEDGRPTRIEREPVRKSSPGTSRFRYWQIMIRIIVAFRCSDNYVPDTLREETNALMPIVVGAI